MFSRFHHRRGPSNSTPTSPIPPGSDQLTAWEAAALQEKQQPHHQVVAQRPPSSSSMGTAATTAAALTSTGATTSASSPSSNMPPSLPPIARVASVIMGSSDANYEFLGDAPTETSLRLGASYSAPSTSLGNRRPPPQPAQPTIQSTPRIYSPPQINEPSPNLTKPNESGFIGGVALANLRRQGTHDLSTAAAAAATVNAAKRPSTSMSMMPPSPTAGTVSSPPMYGTPERRMSRSKPPPPPINTNLASRQYLSAQAANGGQGKDPRSGSKSATSFVTPTDLKSSAAAAAASAASAANIANDAYNHGQSSASHSAANSNAASAAAAANARTKKSLPFLRKNPVSTLLGRRKTAASATDIAGMSTANADGPIYVPIRGTRIHDFSAPGPRRVVSTDAPTNPSTAAAAAMAAIANATGTSKPNFATSPSSKHQAPVTSPNPNIHSLPSPSAVAERDVSTPQLRSTDSSSAQLSQTAPQPTSSSYSSSGNSSVTLDATQNYVAPFPKQPVADLRGGPIRMPSQSTLQTLQENRTLSFDEKPLPDRPTTEDSPRTSDAAERPGVASSVRTASTSTRSRVASADVSSLLKSSPSTGTMRSRNVSLSDLSPNTNTTGGLPSTSATTPASIASVSVLPKHMKSTSSRFSFMIGSASEEKLLEERHRQKQAEKKATGADDDASDDNMGPRDSRFDDFDEDGFDYDAMMDDDGLEERIPGVNADEYEEDDAHLFGNDDYKEEIPYSGLDEEDVPETGLCGLGGLGGLGGDDDAHGSVYEDAVDELVDDDEPTVQIEAEDDDPDGEDPDNDQENFAGFVFQRSNPASSLVSPTSAGMTATPRDATGRAIGFAVTKDATPDLHPPSASSLSPLYANSTADMMMMNMKMASYGETVVPSADADADVSGLGIQHMTAFDEDHAFNQNDSNNYNGDDYDDNGKEDMAQYENELELDTAETTITFQPQALDRSVAQNLQSQLPATTLPSSSSYGDDLYYDQGLTDELDFGGPETSGAAFDESIFDMNDTDEYGRPIPGAFAAAQAAQRAAMAAAIEAASGSVRRESDMPSSEMSDKSQITELTSHTSMSVADLAYGREGLVPPMQSENQGTASPSVPILSSQFASVRKNEDSLAALRRQLPPIMTDAERVDAYQAALAAAAYKAAASGKFRRDSSSTRFSPEPTSSPPTFDMDGVRGTGLGLQGLNLGGGESAVESSPVAAATASGLKDEVSGLPGSHAHLAYAFTSERDMDYHYDLDDNEDNDAYTQDMDDYDFDDDAIIAEANAEALANDMDGFYGQEFNFYSAPVPQPRNVSGSDKDQIQFANGGYFIPAGVGRSISGRVVSREPNLTPITERSEYSNRNSVMSLAVPPFGSSSELRSPGLAQLAMLADDNSDMSLSALLRLRSKTFGGGSQASLNSSREGSPMLMSGSYANFDRDRDRGDRDNASSPFAGPTYSQLQLLQKQYPLPPQYHHRMNSGTSFSPRGAASSGMNSENGSDSGSPTLTNLLPVAGFPSNTLPLPTSPIPPAVSSGGSSCPPVMEEENETLPEVEVAAQSDPAYTPGAVSGISSASESVLWMRSPVNDSGSEKHVVPPAQRQQLRQKQLHDFEVQALEQQLQLKERETEQMQKQIQMLQQQQQQQQQQQVDKEFSPTSPRGPPPPIPPMSSRRPGKGHRHKGSADSISYVKEEEKESGESRWVMERRRVADTGEIEILEREVVKRI